MKHAALSAAALALLLAACGEPEVNPPTEPADPIPSAETPEPSAPGVPGAGAANFVGRWAADVSWCASPSGANRPIDITPTRFEGYENSCSIQEVTESGGGYDARLVCESEGTTRSERARFVVDGQTLTLTWPERGGAPVRLTKCTTLEQPTAPTP
jgi:hypothetical protein